MNEWMRLENLTASFHNNRDSNKVALKKVGFSSFFLPQLGKLSTQLIG